MRTGEGFELAQHLAPETPKKTPRLGNQLTAVASVVRDGRWRTLRQIAESVWLSKGITMATQSVSSRLRDLRKPEFGGHVIERRKAAEGLFEYRAATPW